MFWKAHAFRENNTRTKTHFCCQFAGGFRFPIDREIYEWNSLYVRTALVAHMQCFSDAGEKSQKQQPEMIIQDGIETG